MCLQYPGLPQDTNMQDVSIVSRYTLGYIHVGCIYSIQVHPRIQGCRMYLQYQGTSYDTDMQDVSIVSRSTLGYRDVRCMHLQYPGYPRIQRCRMYLSEQRYRMDLQYPAQFMIQRYGMYLQYPGPSYRNERFEVLQIKIEL